MTPITKDEVRTIIDAAVATAEGSWLLRLSLQQKAVMDATKARLHTDAAFTAQDVADDATKLLPAGN